MASISRPGSTCGIDLLCPLCVGSDFAQVSLCQNRRDMHRRWGDEDELMGEEEYREWSMERLRELGELS